MRPRLMRQGAQIFEKHSNGDFGYGDFGYLIVSLAPLSICIMSLLSCSREWDIYLMRERLNEGVRTTEDIQRKKCDQGLCHIIARLPFAKSCALESERGLQHALLG
eukprot:1378257-Amorphochlora_amoeboformis.AAC.1